MQRFVLGAYWSARRDELEECVYQTRRCFAGLAAIDPLLARWFELGRYRKNALERDVDTRDVQALQALLLRGRNRRDIDRAVIGELGFTLNLWNGADEGIDASVRIHCGSYSERVGNSVVVDLPYRSETLEWVAKASSLLALVARIWRPEWAGIMSKTAMRERNFAADYPFVDWMVYVPRSIEEVPPPGCVESIDGLGSILIVQPHPPVGGDHAELSRIREVENLLAVTRR